MKPTLFDRICMIGALPLLLTACGSNHLIYVQESSLGVNVTGGTEGPQKISLGYDRDVYAIVPKMGRDRNAMSLLSMNKADITGIRDMKVSEFVAAGRPATTLAGRPDLVLQLRSKLYTE